MTTITLRPLAFTECLLLALPPRPTRLRARLLRINDYLCERANRDTPEEQEVYDLIWPPVDIGGSD